MRKIIAYLICLSAFSCQTSFAQTPEVIRGPYLNRITGTSATIRWRTNQPADSKVSFGTSLNSLAKVITDSKTVSDHEMVLKGLKPSTEYFYAFGSATASIEANPDQHFKTAPKVGSTGPIRIWALGDFGNGSKNQQECRDAIIKATASHRPDVWIWLGDDAYNAGTDAEYQKNVFDIYQNSFFKNTSLYPSPGNHDYGDSIGSQHIPYFQIFTMPQKGEAGGVPSGSEAYYSVDYGNVHLVSLDSYGKLDEGYQLCDTIGKEVVWLKKDLAANKLPWTILYWHHCPYSKGSHDTDVEEDLIRIRENVLPILERYKVDLVLCGHSHVYERTHPILGHYGLSDTFDPKKHIVAETDSPNNYRVTGKRQGVIYIVNGSGGQVGGQQNGYPLKAATYSNNTIGGSLVLDISDNKLEAQWICADGVVRDQFSIVKERRK